MTAPLKILYLSHRIPYPPNKGEKIRSFNEIRYLSQRHEIHLLAFYEHSDEAAYAKELRRFCRTVTLVPLDRRRQSLRAGWAMLQGRPWSPAYFYTPPMRQALSRAMAQISFDRIFVYCSSVAAYVQNVPSIPKVLDFVDSDALKWSQYALKRRPPLRWLYAYEARKLLEFERRMIEAFDHAFFVSAAETAGHTLHALKDKVSFVQNGIDLEYFKPATASADAPGIAFTGAMDYYPNVDAAVFFAETILPQIRKRHPHARFFIIGSRPAEAVNRLSSIPGVTVTGTVEDVRPYLSQCQVAVVPLRIAQGIQNKILEALASGLPVVTTTLAAKGLAEARNLPISIADDAVAFARHVSEYLQHAPLTSPDIEAVRAYLKLHYDWNANLSKLEHIIGTLSSADSAGYNSIPN